MIKPGSISAQRWELLLSLTKRELKVRYKDSVLGFFWSFIRPALLTLVMWMVFGVLIPMKPEGASAPFWMHVLISVLCWNFFLGTLMEATASIVTNSNLIKKVRLDAEVFPLAVIFSNLIHLLLGLSIALAILPFVSEGYSWRILFLPLVLGIEVLLIVGLSLWLSAWNVFYRDVGSALELLGMVAFYLSPVVYPISLVVHRLREVPNSDLWLNVYLSNPMTSILAGVRRSTIYSHDYSEIPDKLLVGILSAVAIIGTVFTFWAWRRFRRLALRFADEF